MNPLTSYYFFVHNFIQDLNRIFAVFHTIWLRLLPCQAEK